MGSYSTNKYIVVDGPIRPREVNSTYSVVMDTHIKGGYHVYKTIEERDGILFDLQQNSLIPESQILKKGMICYIISINKSYRLITEPSEWDLERFDENWQAYPIPDDWEELHSGSVHNVFYTNDQEVPYNVGGIKAGETFNEVPLSDPEQLDMWTKLLYPYLSPNFSSFSIQEISGNSLGWENPIPQVINFEWSTVNSESIQPGSLVIKDQETNSILAENINDEEPRIKLVDLGAPIEMPYWEATYRFRLEGETTQGEPIHRDLVIRWNDYPTLPKITKFTMDGESSYELDESESTPSNPLFEWEVDNEDYIDFNEGFEIKVLPNQIVASGLEGYSYSSNLSPISGVEGDTKTIRIRGWDVTDRVFYRDIKITWEKYLTPEINTFSIEDENTNLIEGDTFNSPTVFSWNISNIQNVTPGSLKITRKNELEIWFEDTNEEHIDSGISQVEITHDPITHNEVTSEVFEISIQDTQGNTYTKIVGIQWNEAATVFYQVFLNSTPEGYASFEGDGSYEEGDEVAINVFPNDKVNFLNWDVQSGGISFTDPENEQQTFVMPATNVGINAIVQPPSEVDTVWPTPTHQNHSHIVIESEGETNTNTAEEVRVSSQVNCQVFVTDDKYIFIDVKRIVAGTVEDTYSSKSFNFIMPNNNVSLQLNLQSPNQFSIVVSPSSAGGVATFGGQGTYKEGDNVSFYLDHIFDAQYTFDYWEVTDDESGTVVIPNIEEPLGNEFSMPNNKVEITAHFRVPHVVQINTNHLPSGSDFSGAETYAEDQLVTLGVVSLPSGYTFDYWEVEEDASNTVVIDNPNSETASFDMPHNNVIIKPHLTDPPPEYLYYGAEVANQFFSGWPPSPVETFDFIDLSDGAVFDTAEGDSGTNHPKEVPKKFFQTGFLQ